MKPLVSVLTPSYGQARWLEDNLRSVETQTYPSIEHVVMDGGSTDGSVALLESRSRDGLIWASQPDEGQSDAINRAYARSSGDIIGWLNSDDAYFDRRVVSWAVAMFEARPEIDVLYGHAALVNADGLILQLMWSPTYRAALLPRFNFIIQPTVFIRRRAIAGDDLVDVRYESAMDRELWLRLRLHCRFARVPRVLAIDRHQPGRKVYTRPDLATHDTEALRKTHGIPSGPVHVATRKMLKVAFRVAGVGLIPSARCADLAFDGRYDGVARLLFRQIGRRRASMPMDDQGPRDASGGGSIL